MSLYELKSALYSLIDIISAYESLMELPDCNVCGRSRRCGYLPQPGQTVRINCPLWMPMTEEVRRDAEGTSGTDTREPESAHKEA